MKNLSILVAAGAFALVGSLAFAQAPSPSTSDAPTTSAPTTDMQAPSRANPTDKAALAKKCSADADAQGLHGKARKHFRNRCKHGKS